MSRRHYNLPSLTTLAAFEAAARRLSFKEAAQELSVTPGAVSHQVRALEQELGLPLFLRRHRGVELTGEGEQLFQSLASSFAQISRSLRSLRAHGTGQGVSIGATSAVSSLYLSSAVLRFWREHPEANVSQQVQDGALRDLPKIDMYIRYGRERGSALEQIELYQDRLVPVGNDDIAARLQGCTLAELARERLIYLDSVDRSWTGWAQWFRELGYGGPIARGLRVNNYSVVLQAAREGAGLALGWQRLVTPLLGPGRLTRIAPHSLRAPHSFYLISRPDAELCTSGQALKSFIIREIASGTDEISSSVG
ncbi:LysR substrate-binding domain-containing protein [Sulfitobacter aestuarii]|uniref:LysR substrate-binding domain-containing protein n=1 Tax=Sulfitobacter aestuarii TaxID=2161676 RepID=A0ABW5U428_9RHOB